LQDAGDVEFVVHSDTPGEAPRSAAAHLTAADSAAADAIPAAEKGQQTSPLDEASPITPPQIQTNRMVPSSRSSTAGSDNGDIPVTFTANRLGHVTSQDSYERGTFQNGVATPAFQDSYGASRQVSESTGREDPWVSLLLCDQSTCWLLVCRHVHSAYAVHKPVSDSYFLGIAVACNLLAASCMTFILILSASYP